MCLSSNRPSGNSAVTATALEPDALEQKRQTQAFFDQRSKQARESLEQAQAKLTAYQRSKGIVGGTDRLDVFIHDATHYDAAIIGTLEHVFPRFAPTFRCFVEDNDRVGAELMQLYGARCAVERCGRLTVLWRDA